MWERLNGATEGMELWKIETFWSCEEGGKRKARGKVSIRNAEFLERSKKANEEDTFSLPCFSLCLFP